MSEWCEFKFIKAVIGEDLENISLTEHCEVRMPLIPYLGDL